MEQGDGGAVQGLCGDFGDGGGCWQAASPPAAQGFSLVQPLPGCTRWLRAIPAGPREISAGECGGGAGSRVWVRDKGRAGCLGAKFPFLGYSCPPHVTLWQGVHKAPAPITALPAAAWCWGQAAGWGASPRSLPRSSCLWWLHTRPLRQLHKSQSSRTTQESHKPAEL